VNSRARQLRPLYDRVEYLLDLHSMTDPCPPLAMAGRQRKGVAVRAGARAAAARRSSTPDTPPGKRLRDYEFFDDPGRPAQRAGWSSAASTGSAPRRRSRAEVRSSRRCASSPPTFGMADVALLDPTSTTARCSRSASSRSPTS